jgi:replicative DNA helicase
MSQKKSWLLKQIAQLPDDERAELEEQLLISIDESPESEVEQTELILLSEFTEEAKLQYGQFGKMQGMSTGYSKLDRMLLGIVAGELVIIAGKTSRGKTTLALNIANNVALDGKSVLFVTLEMTHAEIASRYMYVNGGDTEDYAKVSASTVVQARDELNWQSIDRLMEKAKTEMDVDLVIIDHLHYFTRELDHVAEDIGRITKEFKKNAIRHKVPVMLISHVRKTGNKIESSMEDLRGSSYIAQDADIVLMVGRADNDTNHLHVKIEKNRNRGYNSDNDTAILWVDKIKIYNSEGDAVFKKDTTSEKEQPISPIVPLF